MTAIAQDLRYALRQLWKSPGFTCTAVLVLGLGISASTAIFAFVDAALIKPLPYQDPARLVEATGSEAVMPRGNLSYLDYLDWRRLNQVFSSFAVHNGTSYVLQTAAGGEPVSAARVSSEFFRTLGVAPMLGRDFYPGEDSPGAPNTVILTYAAWKDRFGGSSDILGQTVTLSDAAYTVIGVLPEDFQFALRGKAEFWTPLQPTQPCERRRSCHNLYGIGRLKDGVSVETARANIQTIAKQLEDQYPDSNRGQGASVTPLSEVIIGNVRPILLALLGGAALLFLIACINVASLLLARSERRKREIAVRGALGATPARLISQFITEGAVLVGAAVALAFLVSYELMHTLFGLISRDLMLNMPYLRGLGFNRDVLAYMAGLALLATLLVSCTPILRARLTRLQDALSEGGRGSAGTVWRRFGSNLVTAELAIAMVLLVSAGLLSKSLYRLLRVDLGFQPDHLVTLQVAAPNSSSTNDRQKIALVRQLEDGLSALPGVKSVGVTSKLPVTNNGNTTWIRVVGQPYHGEHNEVNARTVSADFFPTLQARLLRGRFFSDSEDQTKPPVVVINQAFARKYFAGEDPIGKRIGDTTLSPGSISEIVGVVDNIREGTLDSDIWPTAYFPFNQGPDSTLAFVVRTAQDEESQVATLIAAIHEIDPSLGVYNQSTMNENISGSQTAYLHRSSAFLASGFATIALVLSLIGLYGIISYSVGQRTREIGVRMALGAQRASVSRLVLKEAGRLTVIGVALGIAGSLLAGMYMGTLLFGVRPWDLLTLTVVAFVLGVSALLACYVPARRAANLDPMVALRYE